MISFEVCCGSFSDAVKAQNGGADRIELNSALSLGGLTPDMGSVLLCREQIHIPVIAMLRPRGGGFCYTKEEYEVMKQSAVYLLKAGADGLAFGFLKEDRKIDTERTREMTSLIHFFGKEVVFHRAFDCTPNLSEAAETLIEEKIDRILTSGGEETALLGADCLKELQEQYGSSIQLLAGSGIRSSNAAEFQRKTGITQLHSSCKGYETDRTARGNGVAFDYAGLPNWYSYEAVSEEEVRKMKKELSYL